VAFEALGAATERRDRTHALFLARGGAGDGETAAVALFAAAARPRGRQHDLGGGGQNAGTADDDAAGLLFLDGWARGGRDGCNGRSGWRGDADFARQRRRGGGGGLAAAEATTRLFLGLALEGGVLGAACFFLAAARFGRLALGALARLALAADFGLALLAATVFFFARPRVEQRPRPRLDLFLGEGAQDDAGLGRRNRRSGGRPARRDDRRRRRRRGGRRYRLGGGRRGLTTRRFTFSTTTALLRPWEKLWRTVPCSTGRFR
jgi:hypothetical protein